MSIHRILIVDDDSLSREFLTETVRSLGLSAVAVPSADEALKSLGEHSYDLVFTDLRMPGMDGIELIRKISENHAGTPTVLVTAHGSIDSAVEAMRHGAHDFLMKPFSPESIEIVIERIDKSQRLRDENTYLRGEVSGSNEGTKIIGQSRNMLDTLAVAERIASSKGTVLITGESGTGKERIAHFIHSKSPRSEAPFIRVNCAALSESLLESELFGHERGAFTGAHKMRAGRFELADGGTILLDEIGDISPSLQAKLLRVLEEEEFERVGGTHTMKVNVRVIASTNKSLPDEVAAGKFREDLYYRLHVLPIHLSPLRDRREDIDALAYHFANFYASQNGFKAPEFTQAARQRLESWTWPGNVRELENVVQRSVVLQQGRRIDSDHLQFGPSAHTPPAAVHAGTGDVIDITGYLANRPIAEIEREAILATLSSTGGNKSEAARRLGVTARTLSNKMKLWRQMGLVA
ncbi:MAG: DNA-binding NtrC family response regulator [Planctomycetota bacterium]|jgi:DNA-binding NtrC family response regulator